MGGASILFGGTLDESARRDIEEKRAPRIDVLLLQDALQADVYDFRRLELASRTERRASFAYRQARRTGQWSAWLSFYAFPYIRNNDVVYATGEDVGFAVAALMRLYRARRPRLLVRLEEPNYGRTMTRRTIFNLYAQYALERVDRILCRTTAHLQYLNSVCKQPIRKLTFLPQTCDVQFYNDSLVDKRVPSDVSKDEPYILSAGLEMRDYPTLIQAGQDLPINVVIAAGSPWSKDLFGGGNNELPSNMSVSKFSPVHMREVYQSANFVVVPVRPTLRACGMNVVLEAWSLGKAVIATRTLGLLDYISDGENGLLVEPYDVQGMRGAIERLLRDPDEANRLGTNGRNVVTRKFALDDYIQWVQQIISSGL